MVHYYTLISMIIIISVLKYTRMLTNNNILLGGIDYDSNIRNIEDIIVFNDLFIKKIDKNNVEF
jgi:hypothetical protein